MQRWVPELLADLTRDAKSNGLCKFVIGASLGIATTISLGNLIHPQPSAAELTRNTFTESPSEKEGALSAAAIAQLRAQGPTGLEKFLAAHAKQLPLSLTQLPPPHLRSALDSLCQQRDCHASRLYWYTDLEQAKAVAQSSGKPILSLRLLGKLDEELSCANSRFFRVALYPNGEISQYLRQNYILHWQSVRPAPKVTVDFGDGRKLERTVTGNSIHYILDPAGRPVEALPGLYGPQAFLRHLKQGEKLVQSLAPLKGRARTEFLQGYHRDRLTTIQTNWRTDLQKLGIAAVPQLLDLSQPSQTVPNAQEAGLGAMTKMVVERPLVLAITGLSRNAEQNRQRLSNITDNATWVKLAQLHAQSAHLDRNSQALMGSKNPGHQPSSPGKTTSSTKTLPAVIKNFEAAMALDTVRNEYLFHNQLHQWFITRANTITLDELNNQVYTQLFLTPNSDPWLGLVPDDVYSAIEGNGLIQ
jgi:hypothetical protein